MSLRPCRNERFSLMPAYHTNDVLTATFLSFGVSVSDFFCTGATNPTFSMYTSRIWGILLTKRLQKPSQSRCRSPAHPPFVAHATSPSGRRESFKGRAKPWLPLRGSWHCAAMTERAFFLYPLASRCSSAGVMPNSRLYWAEKWLKLLYPSCTATLLTVRLVVRSSRWASSSFCWMT